MPVSVNCCVPHPPVRNNMHSELHSAEIAAGSQECTVHVPEHKHSTEAHLHCFLLCASGHVQHTLHGKVRLSHVVQRMNLRHS